MKKTFDYFWSVLPEEIVINEKHYNLWITPYDVSYMSFSTKNEYHLLHSIQKDLTIKDRMKSLLDMLEKMEEWCKENKFIG